MALIQCSECGAQISNTAIQCPKCGAPNSIEKTVSIDTSPSDTEISKPIGKKRKPNMIMILGMILGGIIVIVFLGFQIHSSLLSKEEALNNANAKQDSMPVSNRPVNSSLTTTQNNKSQNQNSNQTANIIPANTARTNLQALRNNWNRYIFVQRSGYTYRNAGGIYDLYITVTNNTDYVLNNVRAVFSYIKSNGGLYKTETMLFSNVQPHTSLRSKAPDSNRGTKVDNVGIIGVISNQMDFCYPSGTQITDSQDPYKCR